MWPIEYKFEARHEYASVRNTDSSRKVDEKNDCQIASVVRSFQITRIFALDH